MSIQYAHGGRKEMTMRLIVEVLGGNVVACYSDIPCGEQVQVDILDYDNGKEDRTTSIINKGLEKIIEEEQLRDLMVESE